MASDASAPGEKEVKVRRKRREREVRTKASEASEVQTVDIEELTSAGHRALQDGRADDALSCFRNALKAAGQLQDSRVLRACSFNLGAAYVEVGRPQKGLDFLQRAQPGPKADRLPDLQFNLALAHNALGQDQEAAAYFLQAAQLYRSQGDGGSEGDACMEMSRCYSRTQDWSLAVQGFLRAAESYKVADMLDSAAAALKEAGNHMIQSDQFSHDDIIGVLTECQSLTDSITDPRMLGELYLSVGVSYCRLRCFQEAVQCFQQALSPAAQQPPLLAKVLHNLGAALNSVGQFTHALGYHRLAAGLYGSLGCRGDQARCFSNLAFACSQLGDEEEAAESFIHALQGFRDTGDHLAQVQVCESLAECYLKQRKQQKAVQLYKQALSALSHCKDGSGRVRDRLVERLTAALQQSLTLSLQRPRPRGPRPPRPHPQHSPVEQRVRKSDITQSPGTASNQQHDEQRGEGPGAEASGRQEAAEHCGSAEGRATEGPEYMSMAPGLHSSYQSDQLQHSESLEPHTPGELWSDRENLHTDSETSLVQETEAPPTSSGDIREATLLVGRWKSRFCSLM
ncbi:tetratricopeptide repeat protein 24 [Lates japonicus]